MSRALRTTGILTALALAASAFSIAATPADAATRNAADTWADPATATIHPGVQTYTEGAQCTANFVFTDAQDNVYLGQAAHCSGTGAATSTNGCDADSLPLGTDVEIGDSGVVGEMVYNSWLAMQDVIDAGGEVDDNACAYNDFALIQLPAEAVELVNPSIPSWGGPEGLEESGTAFGEVVYSYGNSSLRLGVTALSPKQGISLGSTADGWSHPVYTATPGVPGDSGSAFLDADGNAVGTLSTLAIAPLAGSNGVSDLASALRYANGYTDWNLRLVEGDVAFSPLL